MTKEPNVPSHYYYEKDNHFKAPRQAISKGFIDPDLIPQLGSVVTVTIDGLTGGVAVIGDHASLTMSVSEGTITARKWGSTSGGSEYGTGTSPTDYTAGDGGTLYATATVGGEDYTRGASIRYAAAVNTVAPVASGNTSLGDTLTTTNGTWTGAIGGSYTYQWQRDSVDISGETANTYTIVAADDAADLSCVVTYTNSGGAVSGNSNAITVDDFAAPANTVAPVASGSTSLGDTLSVTNGTWTANPAISGYTYQWRRNGTPIGGATGSTYVIVAADSGASITCEVTATNPIDSTAQVSNGVTVDTFAAPVLSGIPTISGTEQVGEVLTASPASLSSGNPTPTRTWQWVNSTSGDIAGATNSTYTLQASDEGDTITVRQIETNALGSDNATSAATGAISSAPSVPVIPGVPTISGTERVGETLTATASTPVTGNPTPTRTWQWVNSVSGDIAGATNSTYVLQASDEGDTITVRQIETNTEGNDTATSAATGAIAAAFTVPVITGVPTITGTEVVGETLTASPASGGVTGNPTPTRTWQWVNSVSGDIAGATSITYVLQATDEGDTITVRQIETNSEGNDTATSAATGVISISASITFDAGTYTRPANGNNPTVDNTNVVATATTGPYYLDFLSVTNGTTPSQADMDAGSGTGVIEKVTMGPQANIVDLDGDIDLSASITNGRIYAQYRDSTGTPVKSALTSIPVADTINYDSAAPVFSSAEIGTVDDTSLILTMNKNVFDPATTLAASDFDVQVAGSPATESAVSISGADIDITLSAAVTAGQAVTVAYNGTALKGVDGETTATFTAQSVTNNVAGGSFTGPTASDTVQTATRSGSTITIALNCGAGGDITVAVMANMTSALSSATLGGQSINATHVNYNHPVGNRKIHILSFVSVPSGTQNLVLTYAGSSGEAAWAVPYEMSGFILTQATTNRVTTLPLGLNTNVAATWGGISALWAGWGVSNLTPTGLTKDGQATTFAGEMTGFASATGTGAETPRTISWSVSGSAGDAFGACATFEAA